MGAHAFTFLKDCRRGDLSVTERVATVARDGGAMLQRSMGGFARIRQSMAESSGVFTAHRYTIAVYYVSGEQRTTIEAPVRRSAARSRLTAPFGPMSPPQASVGAAKTSSRSRKKATRNVIAPQ